jgi:hypothetical protein
MQADERLFRKIAASLAGEPRGELRLAALIYLIVDIQRSYDDTKPISECIQVLKFILDDIEEQVNADENEISWTDKSMLN